MFLIGSKAWELRQGASLGREATDLDIICSQDEFYTLVQRLNFPPFTIESIKIDKEHGVIKVFDRTDPTKNKLIIEAAFTNVAGKLTESNKVLVDKTFPLLFYLKAIDSFVVPASLHALYALKQTHKFKGSVHFQKTRKDILAMREALKNIPAPVWIKKWQIERAKATAVQAPILKQNKDSFFSDNVDYLYNHDTIHDAVKHLDQPAYCYYAQDGEEVLSSKQKFFAQSEEVRLLGVLEESYVLALERAVIPHQVQPKKAFDKALEKVCTTITSGFFREYAWENYDRIQALYSESYVNKFYIALKQGRIEKYKR